jgi:hypothetical protein
MDFGTTYLPYLYAVYKTESNFNSQMEKLETITKQICKICFMTGIVYNLLVFNIVDCLR